MSCRDSKDMDTSEDVPELKRSRAVAGSLARGSLGPRKNHPCACHSNVASSPPASEEDEENEESLEDGYESDELVEPQELSTGKTCWSCCIHPPLV